MLRQQQCYVGYQILNVNCLQWYAAAPADEKLRQRDLVCVQHPSTSERAPSTLSLLILVLQKYCH